MRNNIFLPMKNIVLSVLTLCFSTCIWMSCSSSKEEVFYKGADMGWLTEMESKGHKFYNADGEEREGTALMKEYGMNAVRLRVVRYSFWENSSRLIIEVIFSPCCISITLTIFVPLAVLDASGI